MENKNAIATSFGINRVYLLSFEYNTKELISLISLKMYSFRIMASHYNETFKKDETKTLLIQSSTIFGILNGDIKCSLCV